MGKLPQWASKLSNCLSFTRKSFQNSPISAFVGANTLDYTLGLEFREVFLYLSVIYLLKGQAIFSVNNRHKTISNLKFCLRQAIFRTTPCHILDASTHPFNFSAIFTRNNGCYTRDKHSTNDSFSLL